MSDSEGAALSDLISAIATTSDLSRAFLESAPDAIVIADGAGRIVFVNQQTEVLFGAGRADLIGRPVEDLVPERDRPGHRRHRNAYTRSPRTRPMGRGLELYGRRADGSEFPVEISLSPVTAGGDLLVMSTIRDISERKQAEAASRAKDEFLSIVSHELRTPLTPIVAYSQLLLRGRLTPDQERRALEMIHQSAQIQTRLVEDLLDLSRIVTGTFALEQEPVDLAEVIATALETVRPKAEASGIALERTESPLDGTVIGDRVRLRQIMWNLLTNAIKFTTTGGRIDVRLQQMGDQAAIVVTDSGIGIDPDFLPHAFERFRQADSSSRRPYGGLGLGLTIVQHLVEQHHGTVEITSPGIGHGTTVTVRLPLRSLPPVEQPDMPETAADATSAPAAGRLAGVHVLLVEDDPGTREVIRLVLEQEGAQVTAVGSTPDALDAFERLYPDVLVSDIGLPGEDGYQLMRRLLARVPDKAKRVPAIALTAYAGPDDRRRAVAAGYDHHIPKPLDPDAMLGALVALLGRTG
jgi:PAS domain S-box-containing protein